MRRAWASRDWSGGAVIGVTLAFLVWLVIVPLGTLLLSSVRATGSQLPFGPGTGLTLANYVSVLGDPATFATLLQTALFAFGSLGLAMAIAVGLAWLVERTDLPLGSLAYPLVVAPLLIPGVILSIAWVLLLGPNQGLVNVVIRGLTGLSGPGPITIYSVWGMVFVQAVLVVPLVFLMIGPAFRAIDASFEEAAALSGVRPLGVLRSITIPALAPAIAATAIYQFVTVVQAFDVPLVIGAPAGVSVLSSRVYQRLQPLSGLPDYGTSSVYAIFLLIASVVPFIWYTRLTSHSTRFAVVTGRGYRSRRTSLGRWRFLAFAFVAAYVLVAFGLPVFIMVWMSLHPFYVTPSIEALASISMQSYVTVFTDPTLRAAVANTLVVSVTGATLCALVALIAGWAVVRVRTRLRFVFDGLAFATHAIPGVVLGLSLLFVYLSLSIATGLRIYGTAIVLVIGIATLPLGFAVRATTVSLGQIHPELEEASQMASASWLATMRHVVAPMLSSAMFSVWVIGLIAGLTNLSLTAVLASPGNEMLSVDILFRWSQGEVATASAMGTLLIILGVVAVTAVRLPVERRS